MPRSRFATPLMLTLTAAGTLGLASAQAGIVDLPAGYGLVQDAPAKTQHEGKCGTQHRAEHEKNKHEGQCGAQHAEHMKDGHEGKCGADHHTDAEHDKAEQEGKCGEGKCGEGKCGGSV